MKVWKRKARDESRERNKMTECRKECEFQKRKFGYDDIETDEAQFKKTCGDYTNYSEDI